MLINTNISYYEEKLKNLSVALMILSQIKTYFNSLLDIFQKLLLFNACK